MGTTFNRGTQAGILGSNPGLGALGNLRNLILLSPPLPAWESLQPIRKLVEELENCFEILAEGKICYFEGSIPTF
jgi:hypothetical protein